MPSRDDSARPCALNSSPHLPHLHLLPRRGQQDGSRLRAEGDDYFGVHMKDLFPEVHEAVPDLRPGRRLVLRRSALALTDPRASATGHAGLIEARTLWLLSRSLPQNQRSLAPQTPRTFSATDLQCFPLA